MPLRVLAVLVALAAGLLAAPQARADGAQGAASGREVVLVANAEGATVSVVDARTLKVLRTLDVAPDGREAEVGTDDPVQALLGQRIVELAGGENLAQDQDVSPDGRTLYVSRGHRGDVAAFDLRTGALRWKVRIPGVRSDHMTISADGRRLYVSALTDNRVYVLDTRARALVDSVGTGQWPHDNHLSEDGERLYNASIGTIVAPEESRRALRPPPYLLSVLDADDLTPRRAIPFERGIRPIVLTHDERTLFAQLSEFHGLVEVDLREGRIRRELELPVDDGVTEDDYDFEAPHHGLAISGDESTLCAAGRASDYVALVATRTLRPTAVIEVDDGPGWAATGPDGRRCFVPNTRADTLSVISYAGRREIARLRVGDGPKQIEAARIPERVLCGVAGVPGCRRTVRLRSACSRSGALQVRATGDLDAVRHVRFAVGRRRVRDARPPFRAVFGPRTLRRTRATRLVARIGFLDRTLTVARRTSRLRRCRRVPVRRSGAGPEPDRRG